MRGLDESQMTNHKHGTKHLDHVYLPATEISFLSRVTPMGLANLWKTGNREYVASMGASSVMVQMILDILLLTSSVLKSFQVITVTTRKFQFNGFPPNKTGFIRSIIHACTFLSKNYPNCTLMHLISFRLKFINKTIDFYPITLSLS